MKCEKCGLDPIGFKDVPAHICLGEEKKPNPSPQEIYRHIYTGCEHRAFDEFMKEGWGVYWCDPKTNEALEIIRKTRPDWYKWLIEKGLLPKKMVQREAWIGFGRDDEGKLFLMGRDMFPKLYDSALAAREDTIFYKNIPAPVKIEWEEPE